MHLEDIFGSSRAGIVWISAASPTIVLEFNEFLRRIARGEIGEDDIIVARAFTGGKRWRVGDLHLFARIRSGEVSVEGLPLRVPDGVLASGQEALHLLYQVEERARPFRFLPPYDPAQRELLRAVTPAASTSPPQELLRSATRKE